MLVFPKITLVDFNGSNYVQLHAARGTIGDLKQTLGRKTGKLSWDMKVGHFYALLGLVSENHGISAVPSLVNLKRPDLNFATRPVIAPEVSRKLGIVTKRERSLASAGKALASVCRTIIRQVSR